MPSNWAKLQTKLGAGTKRKIQAGAEAPPNKKGAHCGGGGNGGGSNGSSSGGNSSQTPVASEKQPRIAPAPLLLDQSVYQPEALTTRIALDCEMVGVGDGGKRSALARVVIVNFDEQVVYATFVRPPEPVTDWRTAVSGVKPQDMRHALPLRKVQDDVGALLKSRVIVGHALQNDLKALMLDHPKRDTRDTATFPPFRKQQGAGTAPRRLQWLAKEFLGWEIQGAEHSPSEDAVAALRLYKLKMNEWERAVASGQVQSHTQRSGFEKALAKGKIAKKRLKHAMGGNKGGKGR